MVLKSGFHSVRRAADGRVVRTGWCIGRICALIRPQLIGGVAQRRVAFLVPLRFGRLPEAFIGLITHELAPVITGTGALGKLQLRRVCGIRGLECGFSVTFFGYSLAFIGSVHRIRHNRSLELMLPQITFAPLPGPVRAQSRLRRRLADQDDGPWVRLWRSFMITSEMLAA
jgi:hypothetical protein